MESNLLEAGPIPVQCTPMACNASSMFADNCNACAMLADSKGSLDNVTTLQHILLFCDCTHGYNIALAACQCAWQIVLNKAMKKQHALF